MVQVLEPSSRRTWYKIPEKVVKTLEVLHLVQQNDDVFPIVATKHHRGKVNLRNQDDFSEKIFQTNSIKHCKMRKSVNSFQIIKKLHTLQLLRDESCFDINCSLLFSLESYRKILDPADLAKSKTFFFEPMFLDEKNIKRRHRWNNINNTIIYCCTVCSILFYKTKFKWIQQISKKILLFEWKINNS